MKTLPMCHIKPGDRFAVRRSMHSGWFILYHISRHPGASYDDEERLGIYTTQRDASSICNKLRNEEARIRAEWDWQERRRVMAELDAAAVGVAR